MSKNVKLLRQEIIIALLIACSPLLLYVYLIVPDTEILDLYFFKYKVQFFATGQWLVYSAFIKLTNLILFALWFLTSGSKWRYGIFILSQFVFFQLVSMLIYDEMKLHAVWLKYNVLMCFYTVFVLWIDGKWTYGKKSIDFQSLLNQLGINGLVNYSKKKYNLQEQKILNVLDNTKLVPLRDRLKMIVGVFKEKKEIQVESLIINTPKLSKRSWSYKDYLMFILIPMLALFNFIFLLAPGDSETWDLHFMILKIPMIKSIKTFVWLFFMKFFLLIALTIWFFTCRQWWKYAILIPFSVTMFQIIELISEDSREFDENELAYAAPIITILLILMIWVSQKLKIYFLTKDLFNSLDEEIDILIKKISHHKNYEELHNQLQDLYLVKEDISTEEYLNKLNELKNKLEKE